MAFSFLKNCLSKVAKKSFEIVRAVRQRQRQDLRNVSRLSVYRSIGLRSTPPVCSLAIPAPSFCNLPASRKRKYEEDSYKMTTKRRCFAKPHWENESWAQEGKGSSLLQSLEIQPAETHKEPIYVLEIFRREYCDPYIAALAKSIREERKRKRRPTGKKFTTIAPKYRVFKPLDRRTPKPRRFNLTKSPQQQYDFWDSDIEQTPSPKKAQPKSEWTTQNGRVMRNASEVPISTQQTAGVTDEDDKEWDASDDPLFQGMLQVSPQSHDDGKSKDPSHRQMSPDVQEKNVKPEEKRVEEEVEKVEELGMADLPPQNPAPAPTEKRDRSIIPNWTPFKKDSRGIGTTFVGDVRNNSVLTFEVTQNMLFNSLKRAKRDSTVFSPMASVEKDPESPSGNDVENEEPSTPTRARQVSPELLQVTKARAALEELSIASAEEGKTKGEPKEEIKVSVVSTKPEETNDKIQHTPYPKKLQFAVVQTPKNQIYQVPIDDNDRSDHTPKARAFDFLRAARSTRAQKAREEREAAKDLYKLQTLGPEWTNKVKAAAVNGTGDLKGYDIARAVPQYSASGNQDNWLNDEVINAYLDLVVKHGRQLDRDGQVPTHQTFNSFFYPKLLKDGPDGVLRWAKRAKIGGKNLLETEKVFIPINEAAHWKLCVVEAKKHKKITVYNSLGSAGGQRVCDAVLSWVEKELGKDFNKDEWKLEPRGESPQQTNSDDCGVFTITTARQVMLGKMGMVEPGKEQSVYLASDIPVQRERLVAELINKGLLTGEDSKK